jgi:hypothetical protein
MRRLLPRRPREVSKRGQILLIFGFIWIAVGISVLERPYVDGQEPLLFDDLPVWLRAGAWIGTGLLAMAFAWRPRGISHDGVGFVALYIMPAERCAIFFLGWLDSVVPGGGPGYPAGLYAAVVWLAITAAVLVCSSWPDPPADRGDRRSLGVRRDR